MELEEEQAGAVEQVQRASTVSSEWQPARSRLWDYHYACSYSVNVVHAGFPITASRMAAESYTRVRSVSLKRR